VFALDGCKIKSNASKEYSGTFAELKKKKEKIEKTLKVLMEKHEKNDTKKQTILDYKVKIKKYNNKIKMIKDFLKNNEPKMGKRGREIKSNITDNESVKIQTSHGMIQGYNGQALVDEKNQIIVAAEAYGTGPEQEVFDPMIENAKENLKSIKGSGASLLGKVVIADTGYSIEDNIKKAHDEKINAYIPD